MITFLSSISKTNQIPMKSNYLQGPFPHKNAGLKTKEFQEINIWETEAGIF